MNKGYIQVYTGNGKGKTTAAFGLALRAAGAGYRVFIAQFVKGMDYSELHSIQKLSDQITLKQYGRQCFIRNAPDEDDVTVAQNGLAEVRQALVSGEYQVIVMDEANIATYFHLFSVDDLMQTIDMKPDNVELIITGRCADDRVIARADLVTEMKEVKHYYTQGVLARPGIES